MELPSARLGLQPPAAPPVPAIAEGSETDVPSTSPSQPTTPSRRPTTGTLANKRRILRQPLFYGEVTKGAAHGFAVLAFTSPLQGTWTSGTTSSRTGRSLTRTRPTLATSFKTYVSVCLRRVCQKLTRSGKQGDDISRGTRDLAGLHQFRQ